jgi:alginate O-acetyltransferase complex protein AlgJ
MPCPNSEATRLGSTTEYAKRVADAGIVTLDLATTLRDARSNFPIDLFSPGGSHWNDLGGAIASNAVIGAINAQLPGPPPLRTIPLNYTMSHNPVGADVDATNLMALLFPPLNFATPKIAFAPNCPTTSTSTLPAAIVGSSFMHHTIEFMERGACMSDLKLYFYYRNMLLGGLPYRILKQEPDAEDFVRLRDMKIVVLEENESQIGRSGYPQAFRDMLLAK